MTCVDSGIKKFISYTPEFVVSQIKYVYAMCIVKFIVAKFAVKLGQHWFHCKMFPKNRVALSTESMLMISWCCQATIT